jgi:hypothetical protein
MTIKTTGQIWGAAVSVSPGSLIDSFLDWVEQLSAAIVPAQAGVPAFNKVRTESHLDPFSV